MLENTVWRQYHKENNFREFLSDSCAMDMADFESDEQILYSVMKSKLTKKEIKLFAMDTAKIADETMAKELNIDLEELEKAKFKLYKKFKQDKTRLSFRI